MKQNKTNEDIFEYLVSIGERLPYGVLDPVTRKITQKGYNAVPPPKGINSILPKPRTPKNNSSNKKPVQYIITNTTVPTLPTIQQEQQLQQL